MTTRRSRRLLRAVALLAAVIPVAAIAQTEPGKGLDAYSDERLMAALAQRGLDGLLDRAFEVNQVPEGKRDGIRTLIALRELSDRNSKRTGRERAELVRRAVAGVERALPQLRDPNLLLDQAESLILAGAARDQELLEYWGENPGAMAALRPVAETAGKLLDKAADEAKKAADDWGNRIKTTGDSASTKYEEFSALETRARYTKFMNDYAVALSIDPADPRRADLAKAAVEFLMQYDNAESTVQPQVRVAIGKLQSVMGDQDIAIATLDSVSADKPDVTPEPPPAMRFQARFFAAVADLRAGRTDSAQKRLDALDSWRKTAFAADAQSLAGSEAAVEMMQYRIYAAAKDNEKASGVLVNLVKRRPDLSGIIYEQLVSRLPDNVDVATLDPLRLQALVRRADTERLKTDAEKPDDKVLALGISAGRELVARNARDPASVDEAVAMDAGLVVPFILERQGKDADAATAYLEYAVAHKNAGRNAALALEGAGDMIARLRKANPQDSDVGRLYDRYLPVAIGEPFNRKALAYEYARRLQGLNKYDDALKYFAMVPDTDRRAPLARFYRMVALKQKLDDLPPTDASRAAQTAELLTLADRVKADATSALAAPAATDDQKAQSKLVLVRTSLLAADVARRGQKDPKRALSLLDGFEQSAGSLAGEKELVASAMTVRVLALIDLGRNEEATRTLVALLEKTGGAEGASLTYGLLTKLGEEFDRAKLAGDKPAIQSNARAQAALSGYLVTWAQASGDPKVRENVPRYRAFDAETQRTAAALETDPAARKTGLEKSLALYRTLLAEGNGAADSGAQLGAALTEYDLGHYDKAQPILAQLLAERKLGRPLIEEVDNGVTRLVDNERYWEATLKVMRAAIAMADAGQAPPETKATVGDGLKALYARWGKTLGGRKWNAEFEALRKDLIPDYTPPDLSVDAPPTTAP